MSDRLRDQLGPFSLSGDRLWCVTAPHFVAGFTEYNLEITGASPILRKTIPLGSHLRWAIAQCHKKGWTVEEMEDRAP